MNQEINQKLSALFKVASEREIVLDAPAASALNKILIRDKGAYWSVSYKSIPSLLHRNLETTPHMLVEIDKTTGDLYTAKKDAGDDTTGAWRVVLSSLWPTYAAQTGENAIAVFDQMKAKIDTAYALHIK